MKSLTPEQYVKIFQKLNIDAVIRLNDKEYEEKKFTKNGI